MNPHTSIDFKHNKNWMLSEATSMTYVYHIHK